MLAYRIDTRSPARLSHSAASEEMRFVSNLCPTRLGQRLGTSEALPDGLKNEFKSSIPYRHTVTGNGGCEGNISVHIRSHIHTHTHTHFPPTSPKGYGLRWDGNGSAAMSGSNCWQRWLCCKDTHTRTRTRSPLSFPRPTNSCVCIPHRHSRNRL